MIRVLRTEQNIFTPAGSKEANSQGLANFVSARPPAGVFISNRIGYWKGKKLSEETKKKMSIAHKGKLALKNHPMWKGGKCMTEYGYIRVIATNHPNATKCGRILEHRLVMSNFLKRPLGKGEYVHHKNGKRDDNRIENLELVTGVNHKGEIKCPFCQNTFFIR